MCAKPRSIAIYTLKNITNELFLPVKAFDPFLKPLELDGFIAEGGNIRNFEEGWAGEETGRFTSIVRKGWK